MNRNGWSVCVGIRTAALRRRYGLEEGSPVVAEAWREGILIRPAVALPVEVYSPERKAEFLLSNAVDDEEYAWAVSEVRRLGLKPERIPHRRPPAPAASWTPTSSSPRHTAAHASASCGSRPGPAVAAWLMFLAGFTAEEHILDLRWPFDTGARFERVDRPRRA